VWGCVLWCRVLGGGVVGRLGCVGGWWVVVICLCVCERERERGRKIEQC